MVAVATNGLKKDSLLEKFSFYQCTDIADYMAAIMDHTWKNIGHKIYHNGELPFSDVSDVMLGILTIPRSSAHSERVFTCVRKNKTDVRNSLGDDTLEALPSQLCRRRVQ